MRSSGYIRERRLRNFRACEFRASSNPVPRTKHRLRARGRSTSAVSMFIEEGAPLYSGMFAETDFPTEKSLKKVIASNLLLEARKLWALEWFQMGQPTARRPQIPKLGRCRFLP